MRYNWIELIGYIGIYNGMKLNQIKIDFSRCRYDKIIIRGNNGSGKSTLMNAINPLPETNDNFIPTMEARKTISLLDNGVEYVIRYVHPVNNSGERLTSKGYISKSINGQFVELNPNGNISSCKDILFEEFGLDPNYIALSRLSSENRGLVDSRPAERKKLVSNIINTLEVYNGINKIMSKKVSAYKQIINGLIYKIDRLGDENKMMGSIINLDNRISKLEESKEKAIEAAAQVKFKINEYESILINNNYDKILYELRELNKDIRGMDNSISAKLSELGISDIDKIHEFKIYIEKKISSIESLLDSKKQIVPEMLANREVEFKNLEDKRARLDSLQSEYNYKDIKSAIDKSKSIIDEYESVFTSLGLSSSNLITRDEYDSAMEGFYEILSMGESLLSNYNIRDLNEVINNINSLTVRISTMDDLKNHRDELRNIYDELNLKLVKFESMREIASGLINRPKACKIDTCPYISNALQADLNFPQSEYERLVLEINSIKEDLDYANRDIEQLGLYSEIIFKINKINSEIKSKLRFMSKFNIRKDFADTFLIRLINNDPFNDIRDIYKYAEYSNILDEYNLAKEQLRTYSVEYKLYESKNNIIESLIYDIETLNSKVQDMALKISEYNSDIDSLNKQILELKSSHSKIEQLSIKIEEQYKPSLARQKELEEIKESLDSNTIILNELRQKLSGCDKIIGETNADIKNLTNERDLCRRSLDLLAEYKSELQDYNTKFHKLDRLKFHSASSTGIQTIFMQLYMNKILFTANEMLALLFEGEFTLQRFNINDTEFSIPCIGSGLLHDDISSMSRAQKSLISMILSFSLLKESSSRYNVVFLDEIDGGLDTHNRLQFVNLLNRLMGMLMCEQCFIVSHNTEIDMSMADVILLKSNPNDNVSGNIIWQY